MAPSLRRRERADSAPAAASPAAGGATPPRARRDAAAGGARRLLRRPRRHVRQTIVFSESAFLLEMTGIPLVQENKWIHDKGDMVLLAM